MSNEAVPDLTYRRDSIVFKGPFYVNGREHMQRRYSKYPERIGTKLFKQLLVEANVLHFEDASMILFPYTSRVSDTSDRTWWLAGFSLIYEDWEYVILFPFPSDASWKDGTAADRSIAVFARYTDLGQPHVSEESLAGVVSTCGSLFDRAYTSLYASLAP